MVIEREGRAFELTTDELERAYREQELIYRFSDLVERLEFEHEWGDIPDAIFSRFMEDEDLQREVLCAFDQAYDCNRSENDMWNAAWNKVIKRLCDEKKPEILQVMDHCLESGELSRESHDAMSLCGDLIERACRACVEKGASAEEAWREAKRDFILLYYEGRDSHCRPVYSSDGTLYVDVDSRKWRKPCLATKLNNAFDAEPDVPVTVCMKDAVFGFVPERMTD